jgi:hypothetical protein
VEQQVSLSPLIRDRNRHTSDFSRRTKHPCRRFTINATTRIYTTNVMSNDYLSQNAERGFQPANAGGGIKPGVER